MIHGNLPSYDVLVQDGRCRIIDVPQALDAGTDGAFTLLLRDIENLAASFSAAGLDSASDEAPRKALSPWPGHGYG